MTSVGGTAEVPQVGNRYQVTQLRDAHREPVHQQLLVVEPLLYNGRMYLSLAIGQAKEGQRLRPGPRQGAAP
jgi:hypothetical protein